MRYGSKRSLRITLAVILLVAIAAIVVSLISRSRDGSLDSLVGFLSPDIAQKTTHFEYFEYKLGDAVFSVRAVSSIQRRDGVYLLEEVHLEHYDSNGKLVNSISGREAAYNPSNKQVRFLREVEILLSDGTRLQAQEVRADLESETIEVHESFRFERGEVAGRGAGLIYRIPRRELQIGRDFELQFPAASGPVTARSRQAVYQIAEGRLDLHERAHIAGSDQELVAQRVNVFLTESYGVERILGSGAARFRSADGQVFEGDHINIFFDPDRNGLRYFEVLGQSQRSIDRRGYRAAFRDESVPAGPTLEASRITAFPISSGVSERQRLERFSAEGEVRIRFPQEGIEMAQADQVTGIFYAGTDALKTLDLRGSVSVIRGNPKEVESGERLQAEWMTLEFHSNRRLERIVAGRNVHFEVDHTESSKMLEAADSVTVTYGPEGVERVEARGEATLQERSGTASSRIFAPRMTAHYKGGLLTHLEAGDAVEFQASEGGLQRSATSRELEAHYVGGQLRELVLRHEVRLREEGPNRSLRLEGDLAVFDGQTEMLQVTARTSARLWSSLNGRDATPAETFAEQFRFDRQSGRLEGRNRVRTILDDPDRPMVISAGRMEADSQSGWVNYFETPRIIQSENSIGGRSIFYNVREERLEVEGDVMSSFLQREGTDVRSYTVSSARMSFQRARGVALYEGNVVVRGEDFVLRAPRVEIEFQNENVEELRRVVGSGGVLISGTGRRAEGERAVYLPEEGRIEIMGEHAFYIDSRGVRTSGRRLSFFLEDERILIESAPTDDNP